MTKERHLPSISPRILTYGLAAGVALMAARASAVDDPSMTITTTPYIGEDADSTHPGIELKLKYTVTNTSTNYDDTANNLIQLTIPGGTNDGVYKIISEGGSAGWTCLLSSNTATFNVGTGSPIYPIDNINGEEAFFTLYSTSTNITQKVASALATGGAGGNIQFNPTNLLVDVPYIPVYWTFKVNSDHGSPSPAVGTHTNLDLTEITNSVATPVEIGTTQFVCSGWAMTSNSPASGSSNSFVMVQTNNAELTWQWLTNFYLARSAGTGGSVSGATNGWYAKNSSQELTAVPNTGYQFVNWTGDLSSTQATITQTMDKAYAVFANFSLKDLILSVASDHGTPDPAIGNNNFKYGNSVTSSVDAVVNAGTTQYVCTGWSMIGNDPSNGSSNNFTTVITNDADLAWQWLTNFYLARSAGAGGSISGATNGWYAKDSTQEVTAMPNNGWQFLTWTGDVVSASNPLQRQMDKAYSIEALFEKKSYLVTFSNSLGGAISPSGPTNALFETPISCVATANPGFKLSYMLIDGETNNASPGQLSTNFTYIVTNTGNVYAAFTPLGDLEIAAVDLRNDVLTLTISNLMAGVSSVVQRTFTLRSNAWVSVDGFLPSNAVVTWSEAVSDEWSNVFYRVISR
jgi:uncharacterized repeat protein (TIGR02543 family)